MNFFSRIHEPVYLSYKTKNRLSRYWHVEMLFHRRFIKSYRIIPIFKCAKVKWVEINSSSVFSRMVEIGRWHCFYCKSCKSTFSSMRVSTRKKSFLMFCNTDKTVIDLFNVVRYFFPHYFISLYFSRQVS